jgi:hypothetical protein
MKVQWEVRVSLKGELERDKKKEIRKEGRGVVERADKAQTKAAVGGSPSETSVNLYQTARYHITTVRTSNLTFIRILSNRFSQKNSLYNSCFPN